MLAADYSKSRVSDPGRVVGEGPSCPGMQVIGADGRDGNSVTHQIDKFLVNGIRGGKRWIFLLVDDGFQ